MTCPECGFENAAEARYCSRCGNPLREVYSEELRGELRQLTVLFCDIVGSTTLFDELKNPETILAIITAYEGACTAAAMAHDGRISRFVGDGAPIYFGYPLAQEDDAQRAVRCGLELVRRVAELNAGDQLKQLNVSLSIRVGIHTGQVVVVPTSSSDHGDWRVHGDVTTIAARLQAEVEPGGVAVSGTTWSLIQGFFSGRPLGEMHLKGLSHPLPAWAIERDTGVRERLDAAASLLPFVGRQREKKLLKAFWEDAHRGRTHYVLVRGEPGAGKSRLTRLVRGWAGEDNARILLFRATPTSRSQPFDPVVTALANTLHIGQASSNGARSPLEQALRGLNLEVDENASILAPLFGIPTRETGVAEADLEESDAQGETAALSPARRRARTMDALTQLIAAILRPGPTILVFEDLHWADESTSDLMKHFATTCEGLPLLGVFTARLVFDRAWPEGTPVQVVNLARLTRADEEAIIRNAAHGKALPPAVIAEILSSSEGNPLFVEELTRAKLESGMLRERSASWEVVGSLPSGIPVTVQQSLSARIDGLGTARTTAQVAATIGREFSFALLCEVSGRDERMLRADVQQIIDAGLAWETETSGTFMFKHALIRDAAYESLLQSTRQEFHRRIAAALINSPQSAAVRNGLIADHLTRAGDNQEAVGYWEAAGNDALDRVAMPEAADNFRRAIASLGTLVSTPETRAHELDLQLKLAPLLMAVSGWASSEVEQACERARVLAQSLHRDDRLYPSIWGLWSVYFLRGELGLAWPAAQRVHQIAEESGNSLLRVTGRHALAYTLVFRGELEAARTEADRGLALFDLEQEKSIANHYQLSSSVCLHQARAQALWMLGHVEEADAEAERMVQLARDLKHPPSLAGALAFYLHGGGLRYSYTGEMGRLKEVAEELCVLARDDGFALWRTVGETYQGIIAHALGDEDARTRMLEGRELFLQTRTRVTLIMMNVMIAEALYDLGDDDEAFRLLDEAEHEVQAREEGLDAPEIWRVRGRLLARRGARAEAEASFRESLAFAERQKARSLELRAALDLNDFLTSHGRGEEGRALLAIHLDPILMSLDRPEPRRAQAILSGSAYSPFR